jgi:hypothetical protein
MKCPKCSYISFDYNQICPKCNKDIGEEQRKLNLPGYKPEPLFLLGGLTGAASESQIGLEMEGFKDTSELEKEIATGMDDTGVMEKDAVFGSGAGEFKMEEPSVEEIATGMDDTGVMEKEVAFESGAGEFKMEESSAEEMPAVDLSEIETTSGPDDEEELTVDLGDLAEETGDMTMEEEPPEKSVGTGTVVLDEFKLQEEDKLSHAMEEISDGDEISLDLDEISDEGLEAAMALNQEDEELSLGLEGLSDATEGLEEMELEPADEFQEEMLDLSNIDLQGEEASEEDSGPSYSESEMLTLELDEEKKKERHDMENLQMEVSTEDPDMPGE